MRAAIAIGSNSTRMLAADKRQGALSNLLRGREETRLFLGLDDQRMLSRERIEETAQAVKRLYRQALDHGAESVALFATSAMRHARNSQALAERIQALCPLTVHIISGEEEARLAFAAAAGQLHRLVVDIGGGSTELTVGNGGRVCWAGSAQMGASRLLRLCPIHSLEDARRAREMAREALLPLARQVNALPRADGMVCLGGSGTTAAALLLGREAHGEEIEAYPVTREDVERQWALLSPMTVERRRQVPGMPASRAEFFPHGLSILLAVMELCGFDCFSVSIRTNLDGYLLSLPDEENA